MACCAAERAVQEAYWKEHSQGTVEAMMLDSQARVLDKMERPEVGPPAIPPTVGMDALA